MLRVKNASTEQADRSRVFRVHIIGHLTPLLVL